MIIPGERKDFNLGEGLLSLGDANSIWYILKDHQKEDGLYLDLGTYCGFSASVICESVAGLNSKKVITVDNYRGCPSAECYGVKSIAIRNLSPYSFVDIVDTDVLEYANEFKDESIDFIFLDADHCYNEVKKHLVAWYPKVKVGGIMAGHDYERRFKEWTPVLEKHLQDMMPQTYVPENRIHAVRDCAEILEPMVKYEYHPDWPQDYSVYPNITMHHGVVLAVHELFGQDFEYFSPVTQYGPTQIWYKIKQ